MEAAGLESEYIERSNFSRSPGLSPDYTVSKIGCVVRIMPGTQRVGKEASGREGKDEIDGMEG
ncbi:uncharacterized protein EAE98_005664 [Botrytis deweyae]|uniref:Uncharacterized protein n=1 Tax=Botrytis deweyae TaxID=2478750 RepID=A0ABQ7IME9_9HELO|nr:uncharacterized protein EAE98_005664 [Botrytis deweyae]KAF7928608.1 hypothetical protein EAE98_005664 [Botrytis deweyae]